MLSLRSLCYQVYVIRMLLKCCYYAKEFQLRIGLDISGQTFDKKNKDRPLLHLIFPQNNPDTETQISSITDRTIRSDTQNFELVSYTGHHLTLNEQLHVQRQHKKKNASFTNLRTLKVLFHTKSKKGNLQQKIS